VRAIVRTAHGGAANMAEVGAIRRSRWPLRPWFDTLARMHSTRRSFLKTSLGAGLAAASAGHLPGAERPGLEPGALDHIVAEPVLRSDCVNTPVTVASLELLRNGNKLLVRARSTEGA